MRFAAWLSVALVAGGSAWAQAVPKLDKVSFLAPLYSIDLTHGDWQHEPAAICPAFQRHSFVYYHRSPQPGVRTAFMAVMSRQGGDVVLVPITGKVVAKTLPVAENKTTIATFNAIFQDELHHTGNGTTIPGLTWAGLAECYAGLVGEQPVISVPKPSQTPEQPLDLLKEKILSILIPVVSPGPDQRSVWLKLDERGVVTDGAITETPGVK